MKNHCFLILLLMICGCSQITCAQSKSRKNSRVANQTSNPQQYNCLPENIKPDTVVSATIKTPGSIEKVKTENVKQRLDKLDARCKAGNLVDGKNREIRLYQLQDCWGNPPADYLEIIDKQRKELEELKKKYTVVEITCNPSGEMPY
jgi:hypothetical protein